MKKYIFVFKYQYFPGGIKGEARAVAILKGDLKRQDIDGIIIFDQKVFNKIDQNNVNFIL